jgi:hypothetical protein
VLRRIFGTIWEEVVGEWNGENDIIFNSRRILLGWLNERTWDG